MTRDKIIEKLRTEIKKSTPVANVDWDAVTADTGFAELDIDSLSMLDLIYDVQQAFDLDFEAEKLTQIRTVGELADFLQAEMSS